MIEKIVTSKTRAKLLTLFLTHIDNRYYLRELERMLDESLSPLRRQLIKLEEMGILRTEYEANLKYYRLNKDFAGIEELIRLVLGKEYVETTPPVQTAAQTPALQQGREIVPAAPAPKPQPTHKRMRYDIAVLTAISFFVLLTAVFVVYTSTRSITQVAGLVSEKAKVEARLFEKTRAATQDLRPDEMISRRWKVFPGNVSALSSGTTGKEIETEKRSEEL